MTSYERVKAALNHQQADRVPVAPILCGVNRNLIGCSYPKWSTDAKANADSYLKAAELYDIDCLIALTDLSVECTAWGQSIIYPENEAAHPDRNNLVIQDIDDYAKIKKVDYRNSERMMMQLEVCRRLVAEKKGDKAIIGFVFGPLGTLSMLRNQQEMYMDLYDDPDAVKEATWQVALTLADYVAAMCDTGVDAIMWDTLFSSGSIMRKDMWMEMEGDAMKMLSQVVRDHGCLNMLHNCGLKPYFDAQIEVTDADAISFLYPPDDCKDYAETKEKYGRERVLIGSVSPSNAVIGTDQEWDQQCRDQIDAMAQGGGFILSTGCEYPANASLDRAQRMIDIAKTYGSYNR